MVINQIDAKESQAMKQHALSALGNLPPFPVILNRLMATLAGNEIGFAKLGELIEKDTVIAGNLLYMVNSALYARRGTVNSVRHALSLMGIEKVRNAVLGMSIMRVWKLSRTPPSWSMAEFNMHSSAVAILSDCLAQRVAVNYAEGAFVAGLLHDVGRLLIALSLPIEFEQIAAMKAETGQPASECEMSVLGFAHAELSAHALSFWNLPEPIRQAVMCHHDPESDDTNVSGKEIRLSRVLKAANDYLHSANEDNVDAFSSLGLGEDQSREVLVEFKAECDAMAQFFH